MVNSRAAMASHYPWCLLLVASILWHGTSVAFNLLIACQSPECNVSAPVLDMLRDDLDDPFLYTFLPATGSSLYEDVVGYCSTRSRKISAVLDLTESCQLSELSTINQLPYLSLVPCSGLSGSITPDTSVYLRAVLDILTNQGISTQQMTVFADTSTDMTALLSLADYNDTVQIRALNIEPMAEGYRRDQLQWAVNSRQVGVIGELPQIRTLFTEICKLRSIPKSTAWTIVSIDQNLEECFGCEIKNALYLRPSIRDKILTQKIKMAMGTDNMTMAYTVYESAHILYQHWRELMDTNSTMAKTEHDICMEPPVYWRNENNTSQGEESADMEYSHSFGRTNWTGTEFIQEPRINVGRYSCDKNGSTIEMIGQWTLERMKWTSDSRIWQPEQTILRITTVPESPFVNKEVHENGTVRYTGYSVDVLIEITTRLGLNYTISEPEDGEFGAVDADGTWSGMIGEVDRKSADMAIGPISVTAERENVVDFATPYYDFAGIQIMIKKTEVENSMFTFTTVFSIEVWLCWFSVLGATAVLLHAFDRLSHCKCGQNSGIPTPPHDGFDLKDSFWFVIASLTLSGPEKRPRSFSSRILVTGFWFFCSIMMATYTANLAALLTLSRLSAPVANLEDLLAQSQIRYSTMKGTSMQTYFLRMSEIETNFYEIWKEMSYGNDSESAKRSRYAVWDYPLPDRYKVIWQNMEETGFVNSSEDGIERVLKGNYAYFTEAPIIKYKMSKHCDITAVGNQFSAKPYAFALQEKSQLTSVVSGIILELQQERILETLKQKWWPEVTTACGNVETSEGVGIVEMAGIFMLVAAGVVCGILTLLIELICYKILGSAKKRNNNANSTEGKEVFRVSLDLPDVETKRQDT